MYGDTEEALAGLEDAIQVQRYNFHQSYPRKARNEAEEGIDEPKREERVTKEPLLLRLDQQANLLPHSYAMLLEKKKVPPSDTAIKIKLRDDPYARGPTSSGQGGWKEEFDMKDEWRVGEWKNGVRHLLGQKLEAMNVDEAEKAGRVKEAEKKLQEKLAAEEAAASPQNSPRTYA